ncbi:hypothetical protein F4776DRAFT_661200 [Hypoxylon sp. NC0597]|nr:hypothetical protein F4776DRAFT_661200 [Hypoxylon sp. NC0597]
MATHGVRKRHEYEGYWNVVRVALVRIQIRVPNSQFLVPFVDIDRNGSRIFNSSEREPLLTEVTGRPATLGRYFLTAAYLMVDIDANTFTLWQANPTLDSKLVNSATNIECTNQTTPGSGETPPSYSQAPQATSRLSGGSIAGIVVGVAGGLAILGIGLFFYFRRVHHDHQVTASPSLNEENQTNRLPKPLPSDNNKPSYSLAHELRGSPAVLPEVSGQDHFAYEMDGNT